MKKAGGIIALIAGLLAFFAAIFTLMFGGIGGALEAKGSHTVVGLGWGGLVFSFIVIVLGAVVMAAKTKLPSVLLIISSIAGAVLGGVLVAVCMALSLVGGVLALSGTKVDPAEPRNKTKDRAIAGISLLVLAMIISAVWSGIGNQDTSSIASENANEKDVSGTTFLAQSEQLEQKQKDQDLCRHHSIDVKNSNIEISAIDKAEPLDKVKYKKLIDESPLIGGIVPQHPGKLLQECIADVFYSNGQKSRITFVISQLETNELYVAYKDIRELVDYVNVLAMWKPKESQQQLEEPQSSESHSQEPERNEKQSLNPATPSFDCTKASNYVEKTICINPELAMLDGTLASEYEAASRMVNKDILQRQQKEWLHSRNQCKDEQCIKNAYIQRSAELTPELH